MKFNIFEQPPFPIKKISQDFYSYLCLITDDILGYFLHFSVNLNNTKPADNKDIKVYHILHFHANKN